MVPEATPLARASQGTAATLVSGGDLCPTPATVDAAGLSALSLDPMWSRSQVGRRGLPVGSRHLNRTQNGQARPFCTIPAQALGRVVHRLVLSVLVSKVPSPVGGGQPRPWRRGGLQQEAGPEAAGPQAGPWWGTQVATGAGWGLRQVWRSQPGSVDAGRGTA